MFDMKHAPKPEIFIKESDRKTLQKLAFAALSVPDVADELLNELDRAKIADEDQAGQYIGIGSKTTFTTSVGEEKTVELVMPANADISIGKVSILTPVGVALLGLAEGQSINWNARDGRIGMLTVTKVWPGNE